MEEYIVHKNVYNGNILAYQYQLFILKCTGRINLEKKFYNDIIFAYQYQLFVQTFKAGVNMNRSEIGSNIKRELIELKWVENTTRQLTPQKRAPGWQGTVWCPSTNSSLQISIFQIRQIFNIPYFPQLNLSFQKKISLSQNAQTSPKNLCKTAKQWLMK